MRKLLARTFSILVLAALAFGGWLVTDWLAFRARPLGLPAAGLEYQFAPGDSVRTLARDLANRGALAQPGYLVWLALWRGDAGRLKAGEYRFAPRLTPEQLLDQLVQGRVVRYALTLVEGWTARQALEAVAAEPRLTHMLKDLDPAAVMASLGRPEEHPEGRFFPDTYHFQRGMTDVAFLQRAYATMERRLQSEWERRAPDLPYQDAYQALIMASIVEKETALAAERPAIAGVFVRRLQRGMPLQTDPTVIYGLGAEFDGNLRRTHLREDGPYNTYVRTGLPPSPIALPGAAAIHAALHPAPGDALYFVARGDGSHAFSATLAEHNKAVATFQLRRRAGADAAADEAVER